MSISDLSKLALRLAIDVVAAYWGIAPALVVDVFVFSCNNLLTSVTVIASELSTTWKPGE